MVASWLLGIALGPGCIGLDTIPGRKDPTADAGPTRLGSLDISASEIDFGTVAVGESASETLVLTNSGTPVSVTAALDVDDIFTVSASTLDVEGESTLTLGFSPDAADTFTADLTLTLPEGDELIVPLTGLGESDGGTNPGAAAITVDPTTWDFGVVDIGTSGTATFTISNEGGEDLLVDDIETSHAVFTTGGSIRTPQVIEPGASETLDVIFTPDTENTWRGSVTLHSDDPDDASLVVTLAGEGFERCDICAPIIDVDTGAEPTAITDFFSFGSPDSRSITIQNIGDMDLDVSDVFVNNDDLSTCGTFTVSGWRNAVTLAPWATASFDISYSTSDVCLDVAQAGLDANVMHILSNDPGTPDWVIEVGGAGT